jgi:PiT family inorganic phosphate transporter
VAKAGWAAIIPAGWTKTLIFIVASPLIGMTAGYLLMVGFYWAFRGFSPGKVNSIFRRLQLGSAALFSLSHGANDAQKTMGIIVGLLISSQEIFANETGWLRHLHLANADSIPLWVEMGAYTAIALGTLLGGWRIVHTMGSRITKLRPVGGCAAETGGAIAILIATRFGIPVSTTHTITGAIVGVGAVTRLSAVRWGVASRIVWAWVLTIPAAATVAAIMLVILESVAG